MYQKKKFFLILKIYVLINYRNPRYLVFEVPVEMWSSFSNVVYVQIVHIEMSRTRELIIIIYHLSSLFITI